MSTKKSMGLFLLIFNKSLTLQFKQHRHHPELSMAKCVCTSGAHLECTANPYDVHIATIRNANERNKNHEYQQQLFNNSNNNNHHQCNKRPPLPPPLPPLPPWPRDHERG